MIAKCAPPFVSNTYEAITLGSCDENHLEINKNSLFKNLYSSKQTPVEDSMLSFLCDAI